MSDPPSGPPPAATTAPASPPPTIADPTPTQRPRDAPRPASDTPALVPDGAGAVPDPSPLPVAPHAAPVAPPPGGAPAPADPQEPAVVVPIRGGRAAERPGAILALSLLLYLAAGFGMAYVAGFSVVDQRLDNINWGMIALAVGAVTIGFCGYYMAYRGLYLVEDGPELPPRLLFALVTTSFGGMLAHGGGALDRLAVSASGAAADREARVRVTALGGFEH